MKLCSTYGSCFLSNKVSIVTNFIKIGLSLVYFFHHTIFNTFWSLSNHRHYCFLCIVRLRWNFFWGSDMFEIRKINKQNSEIVIVVFCENFGCLNCYSKLELCLNLRGLSRQILSKFNILSLFCFVSWLNNSNLGGSQSAELPSWIWRQIRPSKT